MLRRKLVFSMLFLLPASNLGVYAQKSIGRAQSIVGQWQGTIKTPRPLRSVLKVSVGSGGKLQAYFVSVDQAPEHVPVTSISLAHGELDFSIAMIQGSYHGKLSSDGSKIEGTWTQGSPLPLDFQRATDATSWLTKSKTRMVAVAPGVSLEVVDWGGGGPPLVFLAGLGNTAHVFDNFAPKFVPSYHAYGITRRGFGASSSPVPNGSNYSADQLGDDVLKVMDALGLKKPVLIGHSIAGEELSSIGSRYPDRVAGLIYLDAGYPYALYSTDSGDSRLDAEELQSDLNAFLADRPETDQKEIIATTLADLSQLQKDLESHQKMAELLPPPPNSTTRPEPPFADAAAAIINGEQKYTNIQVPILAIFASPHSTARLPHMPEDKKAEFIALDQAKSAAQAKAFEKLKSAKMVILPNADHYVFLSNEQDIEKDMKDFLASLNARGS
ncbi:MAG: alpha/beta hydrolase [Terracidiphilus sp.]